ncbi:MAG: hypothetical protein P8Z30_14590 [Acidobacteriota bacterium]
MWRKGFLIGLPVLLLVAGIFLYRPPLQVPAQAKQSQASTPEGQPATIPPNVINGAEHPELVPDVVAYRLWFVAISLPPMPTATQQRRQRAQLMAAGLQGEDIGRAASVLATFANSYAYLVGKYNDSVVQANEMGDTPNVQGLLSRRDALVETTRKALNSALSVQGMAAIKSYVRAQKRNMKVAQGDK